MYRGKNLFLSGIFILAFCVLFIGFSQISNAASTKASFVNEKENPRIAEVYNANANTLTYTIDFNGKDSVSRIYMFDPDATGDVTEFKTSLRDFKSNFYLENELIFDGAESTRLSENEKLFTDLGDKSKLNDFKLKDVKDEHLCIDNHGVIYTLHLVRYDDNAFAYDDERLEDEIYEHKISNLFELVPIGEIFQAQIGQISENTGEIKDENGEVHVEVNSFSDVDTFHSRVISALDFDLEENNNCLKADAVLYDDKNKGSLNVKDMGTGENSSQIFSPERFGDVEYPLSIETTRTFSEDPSPSTAKVQYMLNPKLELKAERFTLIQDSNDTQRYLISFPSGFTGTTTVLTQLYDNNGKPKSMSKKDYVVSGGKVWLSMKGKEKAVFYGLNYDSLLGGIEVIPEGLCSATYYGYSPLEMALSESFVSASRNLFDESGAPLNNGDSSNVSNIDFGRQIPSVSSDGDYLSVFERYILLSELDEDNHYFDYFVEHPDNLNAVDGSLSFKQTEWGSESKIFVRK